MKLLAGLIAAAVACGASSARAIIVGTGDNSTNITAPANYPGFNNVGTVNGSSGIYLGNRYVLTASHVGGGTFTVGGNSYLTDGNPATRLKNADTTDTDLVVFRLASDPGLPALTLASTTPLTTTTLLMVGYGYVGTSTPTYYDRATVPDGNPANDPDYVYTPGTSASAFGGFSYSTSGVKHYGTNNSEGVITVVNAGSGNVTSFYTDFYDSKADYLSSGGTLEAQAAEFDSGGAVFAINPITSQQELVGVIHAVGTYEDQPGSTAFFGDATYVADIATYRSAIIAATPEPTGLTILALAAGFISGRRFRRTTV